MSSSEAQSYQFAICEAEIFEVIPSLEAVNMWEYLVTPARYILWYDEEYITQAIWAPSGRGEPLRPWEEVRVMCLQRVNEILPNLPRQDFSHELASAIVFILDNQPAEAEAVLSRCLSQEGLLPKIRARFRLVELALQDRCEDYEMTIAINESIYRQDVPTACLYLGYDAIKHFRDEAWSKSLKSIAELLPHFVDQGKEWVYFKLMEDECRIQLNLPRVLDSEFFRLAKQVKGQCPAQLELLR